MRSGDALVCECGQEYAIIDGVPIFTSSGHEFDSDAELERLNRVAKTDGWKHALGELFDWDSRRVQYVTTDSRARFLDLLPISKASDVLEVGSNLGQITEHIARRAGSVAVLEVVDGYARFTNARCAQQELNNVTVACGGRDCRFPFGDASFDFIVANLVLEWCGRYNEAMSFRASQDRFLGECSRVLRTGGKLFIATKNRYAFQYLMGRADEHVENMRFGNALPRSILHRVAKWTGYPQNGLLYSNRELVGALTDHGLGDFESYWAVPDPRFPVDYVSLEAAALREARERVRTDPEARKSTRFLVWLPAWLLSKVVPGIVVVATKSRPDAL